MKFLLLGANIQNGSVALIYAFLPIALFPLSLANISVGSQNSLPQDEAGTYYPWHPSWPHVLQI